MAAFMRGGGTSSSQDDLQRQRYLAGLRERQVREREWNQQVHAGNARQLTHHLTQTPQIDRGYVLLRYISANDPNESYAQCLADIMRSVEQANEGEDVATYRCHMCSHSWLNALVPVAKCPKCHGTKTVLDSLELALFFMCYQCLKNGQPASLSQLHVKQSHRRWFLDTRPGLREGCGERIQFEGRSYISAGIVRESDVLTCPTCQWSVRIDNNLVRPAR